MNEITREHKFIPHSVMVRAVTAAMECSYYCRPDNGFVQLLKINTEEEKNYPILSAKNSLCAIGPVIECQILGPWGDKLGLTTISLDLDIDLFNSLPDTTIFDEKTGNNPSA